MCVVPLKCELEITEGQSSRPGIRKPGREKRRMRKGTNENGHAKIQTNKKKRCNLEEELPCQQKIKSERQMAAKIASSHENQQKTTVSFCQ